MKLSPDEAAFPAGSLVLVTGVSGFIASHIVEQLLIAGYLVRGTVRDEKKAAWTTELFSKRHGAGKFSTVIVPEMSAPGAFDEAIKGVQGVIHTASNTTFSPDPYLVITPTVDGVNNLLRSASKETSVRSFVYTSSSMACAAPTGGMPGLTEPYVIDASTWNEIQINEAWSVKEAPFPPTNAASVYGASKAEAEKALWKYVEEEKPHFRVNAILPDVNFGEVLGPKESSSTAAFIRTVFENGTDFVKTLSPQWYINVDDDARLHIAALLSEAVDNERIFAFAATFTWNDVLAALRKLYPSRKLAEDIPDTGISKLSVPTARGLQLLKNVFGQEGWTSLEQTVAESVKDLA